jgi:hypothetical protein
MTQRPAQKYRPDGSVSGEPHAGYRRSPAGFERWITPIEPLGASDKPFI